MYKMKRILKHAGYSRILLIMAAVVMLMTAAVFFFYFYGNSENISIQSSAESRMTDTSDSDQSGAAATAEIVYIDISGCVKRPGVYEMPSGSRIFEVVEKAGGFTKHADEALINQAEAVTDGMKINVPDKRKTRETGPSGQVSSADTAVTSDSLININTADSETLQKISGIGPVTAGKIIQYREANGAFRSVDEITNVSGIGDKTLEKIRSLITV